VALLQALSDLVEVKGRGPRKLLLLVTRDKVPAEGELSTAPHSKLSSDALSDISRGLECLHVGEMEGPIEDDVFVADATNKSKKSDKPPCSSKAKKCQFTKDSRYCNNKAIC